MVVNAHGFNSVKAVGSLWSIASQLYGGGSKYQAILEANREVVRNFDLIYPGQKIRISKPS